jgi:hypothetical protein
MKPFMLALLTLCLLLPHLAPAQTSGDAGAANRPVMPFSSVTGSGTTNYVPLWTGSTVLGNSKLYQTGGNVGVGTTTPAWALDVNGHVNASKAYKIGGDDVLAFPGGTAGANIAVGYEALISNTTGTQNTASGFSALKSNTSGFSNTATGAYALEFNTGGEENTANGLSALVSNTTGGGNTALGYLAMQLNATGNNNTATGSNALLNNTIGSNNTAGGVFALLSNTTGSNNIAIGYQAALNVSGGNSNNIHIGNEGVSPDNGTIRIGVEGTQTAFFAAGIYGESSGNNQAVPVLIDSAGQMVTISSSRRFKEDIQDMADASRDLMRLRPVTFRYKKVLDDGSKPIQYGLIAEEVAEVYPDMVAYSTNGQIQTVKYQMLSPMLLNEVQRQQREMERQQTIIQELQERLRNVEAVLAATSSVQGNN